MKYILDFRRDESTALNKSDAYVVTYRGQKKLLNTTSGWCLLIRFKDSSNQCIHLKDTKESNPVEVAYFAKA